MKLGREFYARSTLKVARDLLGKYLVHETRKRRFEGRIAETEAYCGPHDLACHAARGRTKRTEVMFGPAGHVYIYLIYGMYHCLNFVTETEGFAAAVLVRALEPTPTFASSLGGVPVPRLDGPGRLCRAFGLDRAHNGLDLTGSTLFVEDRVEKAPRVVTAPRIGVDYAGEWAARPWRFFIEGSPAASPIRKSKTASTIRSSKKAPRRIV